MIMTRGSMTTPYFAGEVISVPLELAAVCYLSRKRVGERTPIFLTAGSLVTDRVFTKQLVNSTSTSVTKGSRLPMRCAEFDRKAAAWIAVVRAAWKRR